MAPIVWRIWFANGEGAGIVWVIVAQSICAQIVVIVAIVYVSMELTCQPLEGTGAYYDLRASYSYAA